MINRDQDVTNLKFVLFIIPKKREPKQIKNARITEKQ